MIVAIIIAFVITVVLLGIGGLIEKKLSPRPIPSEWTWCAWVILILLIVVAWWNLVVGPRIGPLP